MLKLESIEHVVIRLKYSGGERSKMRKVISKKIFSGTIRKMANKVSLIYDPGGLISIY